MLKEAGATEVHVVISSPPIKNPCFYGIDTSTREELIASDKSVEEIRQIIGADTLTFLSAEGMIEAIGRKDGSETAAIAWLFHWKISNGNLSRQRKEVHEESDALTTKTN